MGSDAQRPSTPRQLGGRSGRALPSGDDMPESIGLIYDAALDATLWQPTLQRINESLGATSSALFIIDLACAELGLNATAGVDPEAMAQYKAHFAEFDPFHAALRGRQAGRAYLSEQLLNYDEFLKTEYCNDFFTRFVIYHTTGGFAFLDGEVAMLFGLQRPRNSGPFSEPDRRWIGELLPHIARAGRLHRRLVRAHTIDASVGEAWNRACTGLVIVDRFGRMLWMNLAAQQLCANGDGLAIRKGRLQAAVTADTSTLLALIDSAASGATPGRGGAMPVQRPTGARPLALVVVPLRNGTSRLAIDIGRERAVAAVFVTDPEQRSPTTTDQLKALFGLTQAEARVALALANGMTIEEIVDANRTSRSTVRVQVKLALAKTGARRQAELVRLVTTLPQAR